MARYMKIATIGAVPPPYRDGEPDGYWVDAMIRHWRSEFEQVLPDGPDLIVVQEACDRPSGFPRERVAAYYDSRGSRVQELFAETARENRAYVVYSAVRRDGDRRFRNSSVLLDRDGQVAGVYDKNHPTIPEMEQPGVVPGTRATTVDCEFGRVGFAVCFDLNFHPIREQYVEAAPQLILFSSMYHGGLMQSYWAYSCRAYFAGAICGMPSEIRNPYGGVVAASTNYRDYAVATLNLDYCVAHLDFNQGKLTRLKREYGSRVTIYDPGFVGSVMISSEDPELSAVEMARHLDIELLDDYFARSLRARES